jgi:hypothetical protein
MLRKKNRLGRDTYRDAHKIGSPEILTEPSPYNPAAKYTINEKGTRNPVPFSFLRVVFGETYRLNSISP